MSHCHPLIIPKGEERKGEFWLQSNAYICLYIPNLETDGMLLYIHHIQFFTFQGLHEIKMSSSWFVQMLN